MGAYPRGTGPNPVEGNGHFFPSCRQLRLSSFSDTHTHTHTHTSIEVYSCLDSGPETGRLHVTCVDLVDSLSLFFSCQDDSDSTDEMGLFLFCTFLFIALAIFACRACHSSGTLFFILTHTHTRMHTHTHTRTHTHTHTHTHTLTHQHTQTHTHAHTLNNVARSLTGLPPRIRH